MNLRIFAVLAIVICMVIAFPMLLLEQSGAASAGLAAGFMMPVGSIYHIAILVGIGVLAASLGNDAVILLPLSTLLMMIIGSMMQIDSHAFAASQHIIVVAIVLFALCVSMLSNKLYLLCIPPLAIWGFTVSGSYMPDMPSITTPLSFVTGIIVSAFLMMAIGVSIGITLTEVIQAIVDKFKNLPAISTFLSFF